MALGVVVAGQSAAAEPVQRIAPMRIGGIYFGARLQQGCQCIIRPGARRHHERREPVGAALVHIAARCQQLEHRIRLVVTDSGK